MPSDLPSNLPPVRPEERSESSARPRASGLPPASLRRALRAALRETWDRLGLVVAAGLTWAVLFSSVFLVVRIPAPGIVRIACLCIAVAAVLPAALAGTFGVAHRMASHDEFGYADLWRDARRLYGPATRLGVIHMLAYGLIGTNIWFYLRLGGVGGVIAVLLSLYALLFWSAMAIYHGPLLVVQEFGVLDEGDYRAKRGAFAVVRRAFYLVLGEPIFSLALLTLAVLYTVVLVVVVVLFPLFWAGGLSLLLTFPTRALLVKYGVLPAPSTEVPVPDAEFRIKDVGNREAR